MSDPVRATNAPPISRSLATVLFAVVIFSWGTMWVVMKVIVAEISPLWAITIRNGVAALLLLPILLVTRNFVIPRRGDLPIILIVSIFHMTAFAVLMTTGLKYVPVGRSIVLAYTTPLWVAPIAWLILKEPMPAGRIAGVLIGLFGIGLLFNPSSFDWHNRDTVIGNGLLILSALCWSVSILYTRVHRWISTPFQLVFWQALLSSIVLLIVAFFVEGAPSASLNSRLVYAFGYCSIFGVVIAYWAMSIVNSRVPATTTSLGVLATPVVGMSISAIALGETIDATLLVSAALIISGIAVGTLAGAGQSTTVPRPVSKV